MSPRRPLLGPALALTLPIVFIPAPPTQAAIVATGNLTPTYDDTDPWDVGDVLVVGYDAPATLQIDAASEVNSEAGVLGGFDPATGDVTVHGSGSAWNNTGGLIVGRGGTGTINIESGGTVTNHTFAYVGHTATATGNVHVTGPASTWNSAGDMHIGHLGAGTMNIENGAVVSNDGVSILGFDTDSTGLVAVTGTGSAWDTTGDIAVGSRGTGTLNIENGATVSNGGATYLGIYTDSTGTATVSGAGSEWSSTDEFYVGWGGSGSLTINDGGTVNIENAVIGISAASISTVLVSGIGSTLNQTSYLDVGTLGTGTLTIENGGVVNTSTSGGNIGVGQGSNGIVNVTGTGSEWNIVYYEDLAIGYHGTGALNINNGGLVSNRVGRIGYQPTGDGIATVDGNGSVWDNLSTLFVGQHGVGELGIQNGGTVNNTSGLIGFEPGTVGTVTVSGVGSSWNNSGGLIVGNRGTGTLSIEDTGIVSVGSNMTLGAHAGASGVVNLTGGTLDLNGTNLIRGLGEGDFNFSGGTLLDALLIDLGDPFVQSGGTLAPGGSIGQTDIVGDYDLDAGTIEIELGGLSNPIDLLNATNDINITSLGTTLELRALGPMDAGTYTILQTDAGTITGMFENVSPFNLFGVNVSVQNTGTAITITLDDDLIFADPNLDGFVGINDLNLVLSNWNLSVTAGDISLGDLNGDGFVGIDDLNGVLSHWNLGTPPGEGAVVPEPTALTLLLLGACGLTTGRARRR